MFLVDMVVGVVEVVEGRHSKWNKHLDCLWYRFEKHCDRRRRFDFRMCNTSLTLAIPFVCIVLHIVLFVLLVLGWEFRFNLVLRGANARTRKNWKGTKRTTKHERLEHLSYVFPSEMNVHVSWPLTEFLCCLRIHFRTWNTILCVFVSRVSCTITMPTERLRALAIQFSIPDTEPGKQSKQKKRKWQRVLWGGRGKHFLGMFSLPLW